jgi:aminopeptidase N
LIKAFEDILSRNGISFPIDRAWKTWELQKGYPMIHVSYHEASRNLRVTQSKYLSYGEDVSDDTSSWYIPLSYTTGSRPNFDDAHFTDYFVDGTEEKLISTTGIPGFDGNQWFIFNIQQMGYYRVNYDESNWKKLIEILNSDNYHHIHILNRAQLVDDALTLAFDGFISYDIAFGIVSYLSRETEYFPWHPVVIHFDKIDSILKGTPLRAQFRRYVQLLVSRMHAHFGLKNVHSDSIQDKMARELAIEWTCRTGDHRCYQYALDQLKMGDIPKPLEVTLLCNGLKGVNKQDEFVKIFRKFQSSSDQADRLRYIDGLLCSSDSQALNDLFENTLGAGRESFYRDHERSRIYNNVVARSSVGLRVLTDFIIKEFNQIPRV